MSTLLTTYEEEFRDLMKSLQDDMASLRATLQRDASDYKAPPATGNASRIQRGKALTVTAQRLKELVSSMEFETNDVVLQLRLAAKDRVAEYKKQTFAAEKDIAKLKSDCSRADRDDLMSGAVAKGAAAAGGASASLDEDTAKQRMLMAENTQMLSDGSKVLRQAERAANEGVDLGNQALAGLVAQRHTINKISGTTADMEQEVNNARKILSDMHKTMIKHKAILIVIILALLLMILLIIYIKVAGGGSSTTSTTTNTNVIVITYAPQPPAPPVTAAPGGGID
jgi:vesicle transport through interaction with t-SNAREs protein 1